MMVNVINTLQKLIKNIEPKFTNEGPLKRFFPIFEATESFLFSTAEKTSSESVITVTGKVVPRSNETLNKKIPTGEIEIEVTELKVLNK